MLQGHAFLVGASIPEQMTLTVAHWLNGFAAMTPWQKTFQACNIRPSIQYHKWTLYLFLHPSF
jgi:hypothetical protein